MPTPAVHKLLCKLAGRRCSPSEGTNKLWRSALAIPFKSWGVSRGQSVKNERPSPDLRAVDGHLERGDYGQALELLTPLAETHPIATPEGSQARLLMILSLIHI